MENAIPAGKAKNISHNEIVSKLAYETAIWYETIYLQALRFSKAERNDSQDNPFDTPWQAKEIISIKAERLFLIHAIYHFWIA